MNDVRKFSADEVLQIVDSLVRSKLLTHDDARGMTELGLVLKQIEQDDRSQVKTDLEQCYRTIQVFSQELSSLTA